jgi:hypothetical protein
VVTICTTSLTSNNSTFCPHSAFMCSAWIWEQRLFHIQHKLTGFYNRDLILCSPLVTICTTSLTFNNSTFYPHSVFMCLVWIWEKNSASISPYIIKWLNCLNETQYLLCDTNTMHIHTHTYTHTYIYTYISPLLHVPMADCHLQEATPLYKPREMWYNL